MKSISIPFKFDNGSLQQTYDHDQSIRQQIINYFMTTSGERIMRPGYGGNLQMLAFEMVDALVMADYKVDSLPAANARITNGKVLDLAIIASPNNQESSNYGDNTVTVAIRYASSPRTISTITLQVSQLTQESTF
jgi:phage baseplate assembly protein W